MVLKYTNKTIVGKRMDISLFRVIYVDDPDFYLAWYVLFCQTRP